ncbi:DUF1684 domain-containing protein [Antiquaquibacter oligotrophicus]|uniref:DUF1684 domain-containing protein n=1 Tax=Antiquaquibacter oligotrophicus TaxID=2880260 RepID=UPI002AC988A4|nr:DUF1684 domain-containing protein [Antiquaquibacter oligotrophicus]UDF13200.1 DUF1684 domain-containing protein [Antiquaquibacter oligotrophicus]
MTETPEQKTPQEQLDYYHSRREMAVVQPQGSLALVNTQWIDSEQPVWGVPGVWAPAEGGLTVTAAAADGIYVDGELVDGSTFVRGKDSAEPSAIVFNDTTSGFVIAGDDGHYGLRVFDGNSEAIQEFGGISIFDYDPEWVITGTFTENPAGTTLGFEQLKSDGQTKEKVIPGEITFTKDGVDYNLAAFKAGRALQLVFADATNGDSTYSVGRFLFLAPNPDGTITLDFNRAVLPPCAFSYAFNCPLPPKQNRFSVAIEAGEKNVLAKSGALLHG